MILYLVKDGIKDVGCITINNHQVLDTDFHLITYDFKTNEGYIEKKGENYWRLYTQVGQRIGKSRYHQFTAFVQCIEKLKELKGDDEVIICNVNEIEKYR